jgi:hypothetical protein
MMAESARQMPIIERNLAHRACFFVCIRLGKGARGRTKIHLNSWTNYSFSGKLQAMDFNLQEKSQLIHRFFIEIPILFASKSFFSTSCPNIKINITDNASSPLINLNVD